MASEQNDRDLSDRIVDMIMANQKPILIRTFQYAKLHKEVNDIQERVLETIGYNADQTIRGKFMISVIVFDDHEAPDLPPITVFTQHRSIEGTKWEKMFDVYGKSLTVSQLVSEEISKHPDESIGIRFEMIKAGIPDPTSANLPGYN